VEWEWTLHADTEQFIDALYQSCPHDGPPVFLTFTAIHPDGQHPTPSRHVPLGNRRALDLALKRLEKANESGWGAFIGVAPRVRDMGRWSRGGRADLVSLPALFIDVDAPDDLLFRLMRFDLPPSCVVSSGKGYHCYWYLKSPAQGLSAAETILHRLASHFGSDEKMTVAQSMRLPGTVNTKPERGSALCHLVIFNPDWRYTLGEIAACLPHEPPKPYLRHLEIHHDNGHRQHLIDAVTQAVINQLDGIPKPNGWIAARCPCPHCRDRPGMHFGYHPQTGIGFCFGKHGKLSLDEMCELLGIHDLKAAS
jgi:hypothetical protein